MGVFADASLGLTIAFHSLALDLKPVLCCSSLCMHVSVIAIHLLCASRRMLFSPTKGVSFPLLVASV